MDPQRVYVDDDHEEPVDTRVGELIQVLCGIFCRSHLLFPAEDVEEVTKPNEASLQVLKRTDNIPSFARQVLGQD